MRRLVPVLATAAVLSGCGGSHHAATTTTTPGPPSAAGVLGRGGKVLYQSGGWAVVVRGTRAVVARYTGGRWQPDRSNGVKIDILGPQPHSVAARTPQVATQLTSKTPLQETGLWVDGVELLEKGGGLSPTRGTIYGAPAKPLKPGTHVAVAYGRTTSTGTAVAWSFRVR